MVCPHLRFFRCSKSHKTVEILLITWHIDEFSASATGGFVGQVTQFSPGLGFIIDPNSRRVVFWGGLLLRFNLTRPSKMILHSMALYHAVIASLTISCILWYLVILN